MEFSARLSALKGTIISDQVISENFTFTDISTEDMKIVGIKADGDDRGYFIAEKSCFVKSAKRSGQEVFMFIGAYAFHSDCRLTATVAFSLKGCS